MNSTLFPDIVRSSMRPLGASVESGQELTLDRVEEEVAAAALITGLCEQAWERRRSALARGLRGDQFVALLEGFSGLADDLLNLLENMATGATRVPEVTEAARPLAALMERARGIREEARSMLTWYRATGPSQGLLDAAREASTRPEGKYIPGDEVLGRFRDGGDL
jgi:hypothetical protein